jgi:hypothetical protein
MSNDDLVTKVERILERMLKHDERKFLNVATQPLKPKPAYKTFPKKAETKAAQSGPKRTQVTSDGRKPYRILAKRRSKGIPWAKPEAREIHIVRDSAGRAIFGVCNCCRYRFFLDDTAIFGQVEDVFRRKFLQHECAPRHKTTAA